MLAAFVPVRDKSGLVRKACLVVVVVLTTLSTLAWRRHNARPVHQPSSAVPANACAQTPPPYSFRPSFITLFVLFALIVLISWYVNDIGERSLVTYYVTVVWSLYLPIGLVGLAGAIHLRRFVPSTYAGVVDKKVIFLVPTVGRFDVVPALTRVIDSVLQFAPVNLANYRVDIVLDEGAEAAAHLAELYRNQPSVRLVIVPKDFVPTNGTKYKARANHYCVILRTDEGESLDDVFVYHMDDDTAVGRDTIASIAEFIANDRKTLHVAQGMLSYPRELTPNHFCWLADAVRPADDLSRFHFFTQVLHRPLAGFHGEHLLIRASIEAEIGWDFGPAVKVEDAYFALTFLERYPNHSAFLNSACYGASPATVRDLIKQRRRWAAGLFGMAFDRRFSLKSKGPLLYAMGNWGFGIFQHAGLVLFVAYLLGTLSTSPITQEVSVVWAFNLSYILWLYVEGLRVNLAVSRDSKSFVGNAFGVIVLLVVFAALEGWSALLGLYDFLTGRTGFDVITKQN